MRLFVCLSWMVLAGCEVRDRAPAPAQEPVADPAPSTPEPPALPSPPEPRVAADPAPTLPPPGMQQLGQALSEAAQAANEASAQGDTDCERAYNGAVAMGRALHERMGGTGEPPVPDRARFVEGCNELPPPVQRCMNIGYSVQHRDECRQLRDSVDPEIMARVRRMMGQGG